MNFIHTINTENYHFVCIALVINLGARYLMKAFHSEFDCYENILIGESDDNNLKK